MTGMRPATPQELDRWDQLVATNPGGPMMFQFEAYSALKQAWRLRATVHELADGTRIHVSYLERAVPAVGTIWFAPSGPAVATVAQLGEVGQQLREQSPAFMVRMEPPLLVDGRDGGSTLAAQVPGMTQVPDGHPGIHTVLVDLRPAEEEILASFKGRVRRLLRKADDAVVEHVTDASGSEDMMRLFRAVVERAGTSVRPWAYYRRMWAEYLARGQGHFVFARPAVDQPRMAGAFVMHHHGLGLYKDGGSTRDKAAGGLQYLVQWEAMRWLRERGVTQYDMYGGPASWQLDDADHPMHGLVQFKTGFGPFVDYAGTFQLAINERRAALWERVGWPTYRRTLGRNDPYFY